MRPLFSIARYFIVLGLVVTGAAFWYGESQRTAYEPTEVIDHTKSRGLASLIETPIKLAIDAADLALHPQVFLDAERDPIAVLNRGAADGVEVSRHSYTMKVGDEERDFHDIVLDCGRAGEAMFTVSLPKAIPADGLETAVLISGVAVGQHSLEKIYHHGNSAIIAYEFSDVLKGFADADSVPEALELREAGLDVPGQLTTIFRWAARQPWSDHTPINLLGVSFGGVFLPATYHLAQHEEVPMGPSVIAYSGAGIYDLIYNNLSDSVENREMAANLASLLYKPLEPSRHLPKLQGNFLIIVGLRDQKFPKSTRDRLIELTPEPKKVIELDTEHVTEDNVELLNQIVDISRVWINDQRRAAGQPVR